MNGHASCSLLYCYNFQMTFSRSSCSLMPHTTDTLSADLLPALQTDWTRVSPLSPCSSSHTRSLTASYLRTAVSLRVSGSVSVSAEDPSLSDSLGPSHWWCVQQPQPINGSASLRPHQRHRHMLEGRRAGGQDDVQVNRAIHTHWSIISLYGCHICYIRKLTFYE